MRVNTTDYISSKSDDVQQLTLEFYNPCGWLTRHQLKSVEYPPGHEALSSRTWSDRN